MKGRKKIKAPRENTSFRSSALRKKRRGCSCKKTEDLGSFICDIEGTWKFMGGVKRIMRNNFKLVKKWDGGMSLEPELIRRYRGAQMYKVLGMLFLAGTRLDCLMCVRIWSGKWISIWIVLYENMRESGEGEEFINTPVADVSMIACKIFLQHCSEP